MNRPFLLYLAALFPRLLWLALKIDQIPIEELYYAYREGAYWDPLPQLFFKVAFAASWHNIKILCFYHALFAALISPLAYFLARKLSLSEREALFAGLIAAFYPYYVSVSFFQ